VRARMNSWMENAEILFSKGMHAQAMKMVAKCKDAVKDLDDPVRELEIHSWERKYIGDLKASGMEEKMSASFRESFAAIERLRDHLELRSTYFDFLWIIRRNMSVRDEAVIAELEKMVQHPLLAQDESRLDGFYQKLGYYNSWNIYHFLTGNKEEAYNCMKKIMDMWEAHPEIRLQNIDLYIAGMNNFVVSCMALKKANEMKEQMDLMDALPVFSIGMKARVFENNALWKLAYGVFMADDEYLCSIYDDLEKDLLLYDGKIHEARAMTINYSLAMSYFVTMKNERALKKINFVLDQKKIELRQDIQSTARILNLLIHYELGNEDLLEYIARSTKRYLESRETFYEYERIVFTALNKLVRKDDAAFRHQVFVRLKQELEEHMENNEWERMIINVLDIMVWVEAKIDNITLLESFRRRGKIV
jgi:hypothetical protein